MVNVLYTKIQTNETKTGAEKKLSFSGSSNGIVYELKVSGENELIESFIKKNNIKHFGQQLELEVENKQQTL